MIEKELIIEKNKDVNEINI